MSSEDLISTLEEQSDFISDFVAYAEESTDAPPIYHRFMGYGTLSAVVGRNVYLTYGSQPLYCNLWIILIGKSSVLHKSTSLNYARDLIREVKSDIILPNEFTPEKLVAVLADNPQGVFIWDELASFLGQTGKDYMAGTKEIMTNLYDCPPVYSRKTKGDAAEIRDPYVVVLAATTPDWMTKQLTQADIRGGFLPRFICVPAYDKEKVLPVPPPADMAKRAALIEHLRAIAGIQGEMTLSPEAKAKYESWYLAMHAEILSLDGGLLDAFFSRLADYTLKLAMLNELSTTRSLTVSLGSMERAISLTEMLKGTLRTLVEEELSFSRNEHAEKTVLKHIKQEKKIGHSALLRKVHLSAKDFDMAMTTLKEKGYIDDEKVSREDRGGRPRTVYRYIG
jgi:hypothetical protein